MNTAEQLLSAWQEVEPYFGRALEIQPQARESWLRELATTQSRIAGFVRTLLAEHEALSAAGFLDNSPLTHVEHLAAKLRQIVEQATDSAAIADIDPTGVGAGDQLGPYRLMKNIGRGGMSSVWLAYSDGPVKREVALKLPLRGARMHMERFVGERDLLAALTHPNIARLYDAGIAANGQPYLAMEYIAGTGLLDSCDARHASLRERLHVFQQVLEAAQFAHSQLIIHRDLKPSNIIESQGRVVLLDFGIGKLLSEDAAEQTPLTQAVGRALTPHYASPEQIAGRVLGTASDIYSLGVILYELLTGNRPYRPKSTSQTALEDAILNDEMRRPSQSELSEQAANARASTVRALRRALRGDLDTIVLKALKKSPSERYVSVTAFAQDIANYLHHLPVGAQPDSFWYRSSRFAMRYRWQITAISVVLLTALAGAAASAWQSRVADQQRDRAIALASRNASINAFMSTLVAEAASAEKPVSVTEMIANSEKLALTGAGNNDDRAAILLSIASLQYETTGDAGKAVELLDRALQLIAKSRDNDLRSQIICFRAGMIAELGQIETAKNMLTHELSAANLDPTTAYSCLSSGHIIASRAGNLQDELRYANGALEEYHRAGLRMPADEAALLGSIALSYSHVKDNLQATQYFELAWQKYVEAGRARGSRAGILLNNWALASVSAGDTKHGLELYDRALTIVTERDAHGALPAPLISNRGRVLESLGRYAQAREAFELGRQLAAQTKSVTFESSCLMSMASVALQVGDQAGAKRYLEDAMAVLGDSAASYSPQIVRHALLEGKLDLAAGRLDAARAQFDSVLATKKKHENTVHATLGKAEIELRLGNASAAMADARMGLNLAIELQGGIPYSNFTGLSWLMLGRAWQQLGDTQQTRLALEQAVVHLSNTVDADHPQLELARKLLAKL